MDNLWSHCAGFEIAIFRPLRLSMWYFRTRFFVIQCDPFCAESFDAETYFLNQFVRFQVVATLDKHAARYATEIRLQPREVEATDKVRIEWNVGKVN